MNDDALDARDTYDAEPPDIAYVWRAHPTKLRAYEAVYWLNRSFQATLASLERLERVGIFRLGWLNEFKVRVEHLRADTNEELLDTLQSREGDDTARFDGMMRYWDNQRKDRDNVFYQAEERRQEIQAQIKELQRALGKQPAARKAKKKSR